MAITVLPQSVPQDAVTHLSPLQTQLLHSPQKVRIASAPTGAGKSYAFQRAMIDFQQRVLFIVPTRRLAQNLALSFLTTLEHIWGKRKAQAKVTIWSSDKREALMQEGKIQLGEILRWRIREIYAIDDTWEGGEMIFAIPEVVNSILLRDEHLYKGLADTGVFDFLGQFDHIVFDEFHTIDPRGFGLAAVLAKLAVDLQSRCRAKVSFLSATPLAIQPILEQLGIASDHIEVLEEQVSSACPVGSRIIHGQVQLHFVECSNMLALMQAHAQDIVREVTAGTLVVVIYNRLGDLERECRSLAKFLEQLGILKTQRLLVNSVADRAQVQEELDTYFTIGRFHHPDDFKVLIATSSVEMGVTFNTRLLFMEPGFEPLNFLQRYGRAARGAVEGQVIVRWDSELRGKTPWLSQLLKWAEEREGQSLEIDELARKLRRSVVELFELEEDDFSFDQFPRRAIYTAGLYWLLIQKQDSNNYYARQRLFEYSPASAKAISIWLKQVQKLEESKFFKESAQQWCERFEKEGRLLRYIERRVTVVDQKGNRWPYPESYLERETDILDRGLLKVNERGEFEVYIQARLEDYYRENRLYSPLMIKTFFPNGPHCEYLEEGSELVNRWCEKLQRRRGIEGNAWREYPEAMEAAEKLVRATGLVVGERDQIALNTQNSVY